MNILQKTGKILLVAVFVSGVIVMAKPQSVFADDYNGDTGYYDDSSSYNGDTSYYDTSSYNGDTSYYSGDTGYYGDDTGYYNGDTSYYSGDTGYYNGDTGYYNGDTSYYSEPTYTYNDVPQYDWVDTCYSLGTCSDNYGTSYVSQGGVLYSNTSAPSYSSGRTVSNTSVPTSRSVGVTSVPTSYSVGGTSPTYTYSQPTSQPSRPVSFTSVPTSNSVGGTGPTYSYSTPVQTLASSQPVSFSSVSTNDNHSTNDSYNPSTTNTTNTTNTTKTENSNNPISDSYNPVSFSSVETSTSISLTDSHNTTTTDSHNTTTTDSNNKTRTTTTTTTNSNNPITNSNNPITNSYNTTNTTTNNITNNPAPITPVYQLPMTYATSYLYGQVVPTCSITINANGYGNQATLAWTSINGTSAYISPSLGNVGPNGTLTVNPANGQIYTMTVYGSGGSNTCSTQAYYHYQQPIVYTAPTPAPVYQQAAAAVGSYVALTQIPYTGFDFGATGNLIYWIGLMLFALAGAYLVIYYRGGMVSFVSQILGGSRSSAAPQQHVAFATPAAQEKRDVSAAKYEHVEQIMRTNAKASGDYSATSDSMMIKQNTNEMPRIIIARA